MDIHGNYSSASVDIEVVLDSTPPIISIAPTTGSHLIEKTQPLLVEFGVSDDSSGVANITATINGLAVTSPYSISSPGIYHLSVTAVDNAGNTAHKTVDYVIYQLVWLPPISRGNTFPFQVGSTIPIKFAVSDGHFTCVSNLAPTVTIIAPNQIAGSNWSSRAFYTDDKSSCYQSLCQTKGWNLGSYKAVISCPNMQNTLKIGFTMKKQSVVVER